MLGSLMMIGIKMVLEMSVSYRHLTEDFSECFTFFHASGNSLNQTQAPLYTAPMV